MLTTEKPWYKSKTIWLAILTILQASMASPEMGTLIPLELLPALMTANAVILIVIRALTTQAITIERKGQV